MTRIKGLMAPFGFPFDFTQGFGKTGQARSRALPKICSGESFSAACKAQSLWAPGGTAEAVPFPKAIYETSTKQWLKLHTPLGRFVRTDRLRLGQKLLPA